jgi:hypothetical protein
VKSAASKQIKEAEAREKEAKNHLRELLGENGRAVAEWGYVSHRYNSPKAEIDWKAVATDLGATTELVAKHTTIVPGARVLRVHVKG